MVQGFFSLGPSGYIAGLRAQPAQPDAQGMALVNRVGRPMPGLPRNARAANGNQADNRNEQPPLHGVNMSKPTTENEHFHSSVGPDGHCPSSKESQVGVWRGPSCCAVSPEFPDAPVP